MNNPNIRQDWGPEEHPPVELLRQYQAGALSSAADHKLERHLLSCDLCVDLAEGMALSSPAQTQAAVQDIHSRVTIILSKEKNQTPHWLEWCAAAAILVLLCSLGFVIYQQIQNQIKPEQTTATVQKEKPIVTASPPPLASESHSIPSAEDKRKAEDTFVPSSVSSSPPLAFQQKKGTPAANQVAQEEPLAAETTDTVADFIIADATNAPPITVTEEKLSLGTLESKKQESKLLQAEPESLRLSLASPSVALEKALSGKVAGVQARSIGRQVKGKVVASTGEGIPGVTVQVKGTTQAAATDVNGEFQLQVPETKEALVASFIGYQTKEVPLSGKDTLLKIELTEDSRSLSEVVVTGYGTQLNTSPKEETTIPAKPEIGLAKYSKYLQQNVRHPEEVRLNKVKGRVVVQFTLTASGTMEDLKVIRSLSPACDAEAIRLVQEGPSWKAAQRNGSAVEQKVIVVVRFKPD